MTYTNDNIRDWLAAQHGVEAKCVKNGSEASENEAGDYYGEPGSWLVHGTMPNTTEHGWFFVGYASEIEKDMHNYDCRPQ